MYWISHRAALIDLGIWARPSLFCVHRCVRESIIEAPACAQFGENNSTIAKRERSLGRGLFSSFKHPLGNFAFWARPLLFFLHSQGPHLHFHLGSARDKNGPRRSFEAHGCFLGYLSINFLDAGAATSASPHSYKNSVSETTTEAVSIAYRDCGVQCSAKRLNVPP